MGGFDLTFDNGIMIWEFLFVLGHWDLGLDLAFDIGYWEFGTGVWELGIGDSEDSRYNTTTTIRLN